MASLINLKKNTQLDKMSMFFYARISGWMWGSYLCDLWSEQVPYLAGLLTHLSGPCRWFGRWSPGWSDSCTWSPGCCCPTPAGEEKDTLTYGSRQPARKEAKPSAHLRSGLADGELPHPLLVVHHALLGADHQLGAQHPPGQAQVQCPLGGTGPVFQGDHTCSLGISHVNTVPQSNI